MRLNAKTAARLMGVLLMALCGAVLWIFFPPEAKQLIRENAVELRPSREFQDRAGMPLALLAADQRAFRQPVGLKEIAPQFLEAMIAAEDERFWQHGGVDFFAMGRAVRDFIAGRGRFSGASTITQQLAKLLLGAQEDRSPPRTIVRKLQEIRLARAIELHWTKEEILTAYLNRLEFGEMRQGIRAASEHYFAKPPSQLSLAESALLAALPNAPSRLNPRRNLARARERQVYVLSRMCNLGLISREEFSRARAEPPKIRSEVELISSRSVLVDMLLRRRGLAEFVAPVGVGVRTSLDAPLTAFAVRLIEEQLVALREKQVGQGAIVVLHNPTAEVLVLATAGRSADGGPSSINGAWEPRSAGSAIKPFAYLLALEQGDFPGTVVPDVPASFPTPTGNYRPNNFAGRFFGPVSLRQALGNSLNLAAIQTLQRVGGPDVLHRFLRELGLTTLDHPPEHYGLGLVLGNGETRLLELANAYATVARRGEYRPLRFLRDGSSALAPPRQVFSAETAWLLADMLADNNARVAAFGVDSNLRLPFPVAVKTGTSSNYRDNVAVGFTPEFTVAVWVGNGDGSPMRGITGVTGAAPLLNAMFRKLQRERGVTWFGRPAGVREYRIHQLLGKQLDPERVNNRQKAELVREFSASPPPTAEDRDFDSEGRVQLSADYADWWKAGGSALAGRATLQVVGDATLKILYPPPGTIIYLDGSIPSEYQQLRASATNPLIWSSPSLPSGQAPGHFGLLPGRHDLSARDPASGRTLHTWIEVREL